MHQELEELNSQVPAVLKQELPGALLETLSTIQKDLEQINAHKHASPEFRALMDAYVSKANEAEFEKIKYKNIEEKHEELKSEFRSLKEQVKKQELDLDATREALKASESDLFKVRQEFTYYKDSSENKIQELSDDKRAQSQKMRDLLAEKEKFSSEIQNAQIKVMEANHKYKQLEQDRGLDRDNYDRALRETENIASELREQLELRTRELEYKDALLNQLIKQLSEPASVLSMANQQSQPTKQFSQPPLNSQFVASQSRPSSQFAASQPPQRSPLREPLPSEQALDEIPSMFQREILKPQSSAVYKASSEKQGSSMRWGAVRK